MTETQTSLNRPAAAVAVAFAAVELAAALTVQIPGSPLVFAALFVVAARLIAIRAAAGLPLMAALCLAELLLLPGYDRVVASDWVLQIVAAMLAGLGVGLALLHLFATRPLAART